MLLNDGTCFLELVFRRVILNELTHNMCDGLGEQIGSEPTLPYLSPELTGERLLVGANFASAGIGILNDTGVQFVSSANQNCQFNIINFIQLFFLV